MLRLVQPVPELTSGQGEGWRVEGEFNLDDSYILYTLFLLLSHMQDMLSRSQALASRKTVTKEFRTMIFQQNEDSKLCCKRTCHNCLMKILTD